MLRLGSWIANLNCCFLNCSGTRCFPGTLAGRAIGVFCVLEVGQVGPQLRCGGRLFDIRGCVHLDRGAPQLVRRAAAAFLADGRGGLPRKKPCKSKRRLEFHSSFISFMSKAGSSQQSNVGDAVDESSFHATCVSASCMLLFLD